MKLRDNEIGLTIAVAWRLDRAAPDNDTSPRRRDEHGAGANLR
jgi:hypothetical protein